MNWFKTSLFVAVGLFVSVNANINLIDIHAQTVNNPMQKIAITNINNIMNTPTAIDKKPPVVPIEISSPYTAQTIATLCGEIEAKDSYAALQQFLANSEPSLNQEQQDVFAAIKHEVQASQHLFTACSTLGVWRFLSLLTHHPSDLSEQAHQKFSTKLTSFYSQKDDLREFITAWLQKLNPIIHNAFAQPCITTMIKILQSPAQKDPFLRSLMYCCLRTGDFGFDLAQFFLAPLNMPVTLINKCLWTIMPNASLSYKLLTPLLLHIATATTLHHYNLPLNFAQMGYWSSLGTGLGIAVVKAIWTAVIQRHFCHRRYLTLAVNQTLQPLRQALNDFKTELKQNFPTHAYVGEFVELPEQIDCAAESLEKLGDILKTLGDIDMCIMLANAKTMPAPIIHPITYEQQITPEQYEKNINMLVIGVSRYAINFEPLATFEQKTATIHKLAEITNDSNNVTIEATNSACPTIIIRNRLTDKDNAMRNLIQNIMLSQSFALVIAPPQQTTLSLSVLGKFTINTTEKTINQNQKIIDSITLSFA